MNNLTKIEEKLDKLDERLDKIDQTLIKQEANLELHMMRSDNLEKLVSLHQKRLEPIERSYHGINFFIKGLGVFSLVCGLILAIIEILSVK